jgi:hypothetical protein
MSILSLVLPTMPIVRVQRFRRSPGHQSQPYSHKSYRTRRRSPNATWTPTSGLTSNMCLRCQWPNCKEKKFYTRESLSDHFGFHCTALISEVSKANILSCRWHGCSSQRSGKKFQSFPVLRKHLTGQLNEATIKNKTHVVHT